MEILIVDDKRENLYLLSSLLQENGYKVLTANNGKEALNKLHYSDISLIISDILMPVMDGYQLCYQVKHDKMLRSIPFIFYTGTYTDPDDKELALDMGADCYIGKPVDSEKFIDIIKDVIKEFKSEKRLHKNESTNRSEKDILKFYNERLVKKLEQKMLALEKAEKKYRAIFESTGTATLIVNADKTIQMVNREAFLVTGYKPEELIGKKWTEFVAPESLEKMAKYHDLRREEPGEVPNKYDAQLINKAGESRYAVLSVGMIPESSQSIVSVLDISERKLLEDRYTSLVANLPVGVFRSTPEGDIVSANPAMAEIYGFDSVEELLQTSAKDFYADRNMGDAMLSELNEKDLLTDYVTKNLKRDGTPIWVSTNYRTLRDENGKIKYIDNVTIDITERKWAEEEYRQLMDGMNETAFVIDLNGKFIEINRTAVHVLGYSKEELLSMGPTDIDPHFKANDIKKLIDGMEIDKLQVFETEHRTKEGMAFPVEISYSMINYKGKRSILCIARDITKRKKTEEALHESEIRFSAFMETLPNTGFIKTTDNKVLYINNEMKKRFGAEDWVGKSLFDIFPSDVAKRLADADSKALVKGYSIDIHVLPDKDGNERIWETHTFRIDREKQEPLIGGFSLDITESKLAEDTLKESERKYRLHFENITDVIYSLDTNFITIDVSPSVEKILGYNPDELIGKPFQELNILAPESFEKATLDAARMLQGEEVKSAIYQFIAKDGTKKWGEVSGAPLIRDGKVVSTISVARDITERVLAEKIQKTLYNISNALNTIDDLRELCIQIQKFLGSVIDTKNFYIDIYNEEKDTISLPYAIDEKDVYESFPAGKTLTKYVIDLGRPLFAPQKLQNELVEKGLVEILGTPSKIWLGAPLKIENRVIGVIAVQSYDNPHLYSEKDMDILTFISEEIALAIKHKLTEEKIRKELKENKVLLDEIHHRIKNNLQMISSLLQLQQDTILTKEDAIKSFEVSQDRIRTMAEAYELLLHARYMSGVKLGEYITLIAEQLQRNYDLGQKISISFSLDEVEFGMEKLSKVGLIVNEILTNAMKYAFEGRDDGKIQISLRDEENTCEIRIEDNGVGIPPEIDIHNPTTLGLSLINMLITEFNGSYVVEKEKGTSFTIKMPKYIEN